MRWNRSSPPPAFQPPGRAAPAPCGQKCRLFFSGEKPAFSLFVHPSSCSEDRRGPPSPFLNRSFNEERVSRIIIPHFPLLCNGENTRAQPPQPGRFRVVCRIQSAGCFLVPPLVRPNCLEFFQRALGICLPKSSFAFLWFSMLLTIKQPGRYRVRAVWLLLEKKLSILSHYRSSASCTGRPPSISVPV